MKKLYVFVIMLLMGCSGNPVPKPRGFFRIDLPEKKYTSYDDATCPYRFDIPDYAIVGGNPARVIRFRSEKRDKESEN